MEQNNITRVEDTNEEALASKISAIRKGYFEDSFAEEFTAFRGKRDIIIHRGYWARVHLVRRLVGQMLALGEEPQIVSLGCGLETLWFNLLEEGKIDKPYRFVELDLESVVKKKIKKITTSKKFATLFNAKGLNVDIDQDNAALSCGPYALRACDLSDIEIFERVSADLKLDPSRPTLFYCECVLSYIDSDKVDALMAYIAKRYDLAFMFDYEMYNPHDRFGQMMVKNFNFRGCPLVGIYKYPELADQKNRYESAGFKSTECYTMARIYYDCIQKAERAKIEKIQMLDQLEEWNLIMDHYFGLLSVTHSARGEGLSCFKDLITNLKLKK